ALTGVEAVSNGVQSFRAPVVESARKTLAAIVAILILLLAGIAYLSHAYRIGAARPGEPGYQSVLSMVTAAAAGRGAVYGITMASILAALCLSANTSFAGFPQLCRAIAIHEYLPHSFAVRGRRLVYTEGIWVLSILAAGVLILFGGVTDRLIPLFAIGAFLAFTLSQAGLVAPWRESRGRGAQRSMAINATGAIATGATALVVLAAKFTEGAWLVALFIPALLWLMSSVHRHYGRVRRETKPEPTFLHDPQSAPVAIVPI